MTNQETLDRLNEIELPFGAFFLRVLRYGTHVVVACPEEKTHNLIFRREVLNRSMAKLLRMGFRTVEYAPNLNRQKPLNSRQAMMIEVKR